MTYTVKSTNIYNKNSYKICIKVEFSLFVLDSLYHGSKVKPPENMFENPSLSVELQYKLTKSVIFCIFTFFMTGIGTFFMAKIQALLLICITVAIYIFHWHKQEVFYKIIKILNTKDLEDLELYL